MLLKVQEIGFLFKSSKILDEVTFQVKSGEILGVMGPNGSGKTTLLRCITHVLKPSHGTILVGRRDVTSLSRKEIAQTIGVVPQSSTVDFAFTAFEIVMMGRTPHISRFGPESKKDYEIARKAMHQTDTLHLSDRIFDELSGGEKQRVIIARALCQQPRILLLDEPTIHLDIGSQFEIMDLVKRLSRREKIAVIAVLHDLNLAASYCDSLILLNRGTIVSAGPPKDVLTPENIRKTYNIQVLVGRHPLTNAPFVTPYSSPGQQRKGVTIHVVCGGGSGSHLLSFLSSRSFNVTAGVLNVLDSDFETAKALNVTVVGEIPFSQITEESAEANISLAKQADIVVLTDFPVGFGNLKNVEVIEAALDMNIPVIVIDATPVEEKDFTDGTLSEYFARLRNKGAFFVESTEEALERIRTWRR